ncbi:MAG: hypothetical protein ACI8PP_000419 [Candidatus Pseudothioglobus sp.]|jgi:uncharacterized protein YceH (UPF0502 family)
MQINLSLEDARIIGCLMEKAVTTPDQYPLTLNALTNACNQKSSRDPVMTMTAGHVQHTARALQEKFLIKNNENFRSGVEKYEQRLCNTPLTDYQLSAGEYAVLCLLLLRGPQTAGEIRARSPRLHVFDDNQAVADVFNDMINREAGAIIARLPKKSGRQDHEYMHLFAGDIASMPDDETPPASSDNATPPAVPKNRNDSGRINMLEARVAKLETALASLAEQLGANLDLDLDSDS